MSELSMILGTNLTALKKSHGYTNADIARLIGVSDQAVSTWVSGKQLPQQDSITKLANLFVVTEAWLMADHTEPVVEPKAKTALARRLQQARKNAGYTLRDVRDRYGFDNGMLSRIESGEYEPKAYQLMALAQIYDTTVDQLMNGAMKYVCEDCKTTVDHVYGINGAVVCEDCMKASASAKVWLMNGDEVASMFGYEVIE